MASPYSMDLRQRVIEAVEGGLSCNQAAARFEVAIRTAIGWVNRYRETGSFAPDRMGGHRCISGPRERNIKIVADDADWSIQNLSVIILGCRSRYSRKHAVRTAD